jgi:hypothetical protein
LMIVSSVVVRSPEPCSNMSRRIDKPFPVSREVSEPLIAGTLYKRLRKSCEVGGSPQEIRPGYQ